MNGCWVIHGSMTILPGAILSRKNDSPSPSNSEPPMVPQQGMGPGDHLPHLCHDFGRLDLELVQLTRAAVHDCDSYLTSRRKPFTMALPTLSSSVLLSSLL